MSFFDHFNSFKSQDYIQLSLKNDCLRTKFVEWEYEGDGFGSVFNMAIKALALGLTQNSYLVEFLNMNKLKLINPNICERQIWDCYFESVSSCAPTSTANVIVQSKLQVATTLQKSRILAARALFRPNRRLLDFFRRFECLDTMIANDNYVSVQLRTGKKFGSDQRNGFYPFLENYIEATILISKRMNITHVYATSDDDSTLLNFSNVLQQNYGLTVFSIPREHFKLNFPGSTGEDYLEVIAEYYNQPNVTVLDWDYFRILATDMFFLSRGRYLLHGASNFGQGAAYIASWPVASGPCHSSMLYPRKHGPSDSSSSDLEGSYPQLRHKKSISFFVTDQKIERCLQAWEVAKMLKNKDEVYSLRNFNPTLTSTDDEDYLQSLETEQQTFVLLILYGVLSFIIFSVLVFIITSTIRHFRKVNKSRSLRSL